MFFLRERKGGVVSVAVIAMVLWCSLAIACSSDPAAPEDAPAGHTVVLDGVAHSPGLSAPQENCSDCHGSDLRGGGDGEPSCFTCHGQKWP